jgi:DNA-binding LytR/AlgR family response regulator
VFVATLFRETRAPPLSPALLRVHQSFLVNPDRAYAIRPRSEGSRDWELVMEPPVNRVLPISRERLRELWERYALG